MTAFLKFMRNIYIIDMVCLFVFNDFWNLFVKNLCTCYSHDRKLNYVKQTFNITFRKVYYNLHRLILNSR